MQLQLATIAAGNTEQEANNNPEPEQTPENNPKELSEDKQKPPLVSKFASVVVGWLRHVTCVI